jgi:hypothetical protein
MSVKSAYKQKPAENIPTEDEITRRLIEDTIKPGERQLNNQPAEPLAEPSVGAEAEIPTGGEADNPAIAEAMQQQAQADDSRNVLLEQLHALQAAQEAQRQRMAMAPRLPRNQDELIALWQAQGNSDREIKFLLSHAEQFRNPKAAQRALAKVAQERHPRDSDEFFQSLEQHLEHENNRKKDKAAAKAAAEPVPEYFQPSPAPPEQPEQTASSIYSAPVSRQAGGGNYQPSPSSIRLSREEQEAARMAGISDTEYARNKLKMLRMQQTGQIQK